jgi:hypothetical protein
VLGLKLSYDGLDGEALQQFRDGVISGCTRACTSW